MRAAERRRVRRHQRTTVRGRPRHDCGRDRDEHGVPVEARRDCPAAGLALDGRREGSRRCGGPSVSVYLEVEPSGVDLRAPGARDSIPARWPPTGGIRVPSSIGWPERAARRVRSTPGDGPRWRCRCLASTVAEAPRRRAGGLVVDAGFWSTTTSCSLGRAPSWRRRRRDAVVRGRRRIEMIRDRADVVLVDAHARRCARRGVLDAPRYRASVSDAEDVIATIRAGAATSRHDRPTISSPHRCGRRGRRCSHPASPARARRSRTSRRPRPIPRNELDAASAKFAAHRARLCHKEVATSGSR